MTLEFGVKRFPYLGDHRLFGRPVLSAATIIRFLIENGDFALCDLSFISFVPLDSMLEMRNNGNRLNILNAEKLVFSALRSEGNEITFEELKFHSNEENIEEREFYKTMDRIGYEHLAAFRSVRFLRFCRFEEKFCGTVDLDAEKPLDCQLDGLFQSMVFLLFSFGSFPNRLLVPSFLKSFRYCSDEKKSSNLVGNFVLDLKSLSGDFRLFANDDLILCGAGLLFRPIPKPMESKPTERMIGIRSISCRLPDGVSSGSEFWSLMEKGKSTERRIPEDRIPNPNRIMEFGVSGGNFLDGDVFGFDSALFGISAAEATAMDPQQRLLLECVYECLEMSGQMGNRRMGVFIGMMGSEYSDGDLDALQMLGSSASTMCGRLSHFFDCRGVSVVIDTACSSSLVALDLAVGKLRNGEIDSAIVGGVNLILSASAMIQRANGKLLSPDGKCQSFDAKANGYGRADGCAVVLVERSVGDRHYLGFVEKIGTNHDGHSSALTVPNGDSQRELIENVVKTLPLDDIPIGFWECHGTGTALGDPIEVNSLQAALSNHSTRLAAAVPLSTAKAFIGHTEAASGLVGVIKAVLQLQNRKIPSLPNFQTLNQNIRINEGFKINGNVHQLSRSGQMRAGVSSFGVGGTNAVAVIRSASPYSIRRSEPILQILPLSAKTPTSLRNLIETFKTLKNPNRLTEAAISRFRPNFSLRAILRRSADGFSEILSSFDSTPQTFTVSFIPNTETPTFFLNFPKYKSILENQKTKKRKNFSAMISFLLEIGFPSEVFADIRSKRNQSENGIIQMNFPNRQIKLQNLNNFELAIGMVFVFGKFPIRWDFLFGDLETEDLLSVLKTLPTYPFDRKIFRRPATAATNQIEITAEKEKSAQNQNSTIPKEPPETTKNTATIFDNIKEKIISALRQSIIGEMEISEEIGFFDLGLDSLGLVGFANDLERNGISVGTADLMANPTVQKLSAFLQNREEIESSGYSSTFAEDEQIDSLLFEITIQPIANRPQTQILFPLNGKIRIRNGRKQIAVLPEKFSKIVEKWKIDKMEISFEDSDAVFGTEKAAEYFIGIGRLISSLPSPTEITVKRKPGFLNSMGRSFLKSLCAELSPKITFRFDDQMSQISKPTEIREIPKEWIITGGTSGIGWTMGKHLLEKHDAQKVLLLSRKPPGDSVRSEASRFGSRLHFRSADVSNQTELLKAIKNLRFQNFGIIHSAGISEDSLFETQNLQKFQKVFSPKIDGIINLKKTMEKLKISPTLWILNSSVSSVLGNIGQTNYAAANAFLDEFANSEKSKGKWICSINWANWLEVGFAATNSIRDILTEKGFFGLRTSEALRCFDRILMLPFLSQIFVAKADWTKMCQNRPELSDFVGGHSAIQLEVPATPPKNEKKKITKNEVKNFLHKTLHSLLGDSVAIDENMGFMEMGIDSFGLYRLSSLIAEHFKTEIPIISLFENPKIPQLSEFIFQKLQKAETEADGTQKPTKLKKPTKVPRRTESADLCPPAAAKYPTTSKSTDRPLKVDLATKPPNPKTSQSPHLAFLFGGNGCLYSSVCLDLCSKVPFIRRQIRLISEYFQPFLKISILEIIEKNQTAEISSLPIEHAVIFAIGFSLAQFWIHIGLEPKYLIGHSLGEMIAVAVGGFVEPKNAAYLIWLRAKALERSRGKGSMMAVDSEFLSRRSISALGLSVSALNSPGQVVLSGSSKSIQKAEFLAKKSEFAAKILNAEFGFHSKKILKEEYFKVLSKFDWKKICTPNRMTVISNLTATPLKTFDQHYVKEQARNTVQFQKSIEWLLTLGEVTFLEAGPGRILSSLVQKLLNRHSLRYLVLNSTQKDQTDELESIKWAAQKLELKGFQINRREFCSAVGEDFVEEVSNAFGSSIRLDKSASMNVRVAQSVRHKRMENRRRENPLVLNRRNVVADSADREITAAHLLFGEAVAPAAFHLKCFGEHLKLHQIVLNDVRLNRRIPLSDFDNLVTLFKDGRLQLRSTASERIFSSCSVNIPEKEKNGMNGGIEDPDFPDGDPGIWLSPSKFYEGMAAHGLRYGQKLRLLEDIRLIGMNWIRSRCRKPTALWVLFDVGLQTLSAGLFDIRSPISFIPIHIGEVFFRFPAQTSDEGQWTMHGEITRRDRDVVEGNVWIFGRGVLIAHLKDIRAVRAHPTKLLKAQQSNRNALSTDEESQDEDPKKEQRRQSLGDELTAETSERRAAASTAAKISMALNSLKRTRVQRDFHERRKTKVKMKSIAIRSAYGQFAAAEITEQFAEFSQKSLTGDVLRLEWEKEKFDAKFFGIMPKEATFMDPQQRILLEAVQLCLDKAGIQKCPENCGIFVGVSASEFAQKAFAEIKNKVGYLMSGTNSSSLSGRLAHFFGTTGPTLTVDTACSSFLSAFCIACDNLSAGKCLWAIVASCNLILNEETTEVLKNAGVLSQRHRCATFDQSADGYVRTEGVGVLLLERTNDSDGIFVNKWEIGHTGGGTAGFSVPKVDAQCRVMSSVCQEAPDLIECHGSATKVGDKIEIEAIQKFLKNHARREVYLTASKAHFGHPEAAAGALSVLTAINIFQNNKLPPLPYFQRLSLDVSIPSNVKIPTEKVVKDFRRVLINSFGFTGTNVSVLLEKRGQLKEKEQKRLTVFNRQRLWPFDNISVIPNIRQHSLHFEDLQQTKTFFQNLESSHVYAEPPLFTFPKFKAVSTANREELKTARKNILIWTPNESHMDFLPLCRFCSLLAPKSTFQMVTSRRFCLTARAFFLTVIAERELIDGGFFVFDEHRMHKVTDNFVNIPQQLNTECFRKIIIIGGAGGIGRALLEKLQPVEAVIVGRSWNPKLPLNDRWKYIQCDVSGNREDLFEAIGDEKNIDLLIHCAGDVKNDLITNQTVNHFDEIFVEKKLGIKNSLDLCIHLGIRRMLGISSVAAIFGSFGQINYAVANAEMIRLLSEEKRIKSSIIVLGPIGDVGMLSGEKMLPIRKQIESQWKIKGITETLSAILPLIHKEGIFVIAEETEREKPNGYLQIPESEQKSIQKVVCQMITELSGITDVDVKCSLSSMGADSLIIESLRQKICHHFGISVSPAQMFENISVENLTELIRTLNVEVPTEPTARQQPSQQPIAIIGFSGEFPKSRGKEEFFEKLLRGEELLTEKATRRTNHLNVSAVIENTQKFDPKFFGLTKEESSQLDPQLRILLKTAFCALDDSGYPRGRRKNLRIGCVMAAEPSDFPKKKQKRPNGSLLGMFDENQKDFGALWISHLLSLNGPSISVYSACSSSVVAINQAAQMLRSDSADLVIVGSVYLVHRIGHEMHSPLATEGHCRPFSRDASGLIRGSGCGVLVLRRLDSALSDGDSVLAEISAVTVNNDANRRKANFMAPSVEGQIEAISEGLKAAEWKEIDYIECHATGTAAGDGIELQAIRRSLQRFGIKSKPFVGSVKANIGHSFAASGIVSVAKCLEILRTHRIPPQINLGSSLLPEFDKNQMQIAERPLSLEPNRRLQIMVNNFGIGGTNGVLLLKESKEKSSQKLSNGEIVSVFPLIVSAKSAESCLSFCFSLAEYLESHPLIDLAALSNTLLHYREHYQHRFGAAVRNREEAIRKLKTAKKENIFEAKKETPFALYFGPQGTLYERVLNEERQHSQRLQQSFPLNGNSESSKLIDLHSIVSDFLFDFGLPKPDVLIGHSLGEYSAFRLSGNLPVASVLNFVENRSSLIAKTPKAKTFLVRTAETEISDFLHLMAVLSDDLKVFVCSEENIQKAEKTLSEYSFSVLRGDFGFHSELLAPIFAEFRFLCSDFPSFRPNIPIISTIDGNMIEHLDADYLMRHLRDSVRLDLSLGTLKKEFSKVKTIIEIGPSGVLSSVLDSSFSVIPTVSSHSEYSSRPQLRLFESLISLWTFGFPIQMEKLFGKTTDRLSGLPNYVFDEIDFSVPLEEEEEEEEEKEKSTKTEKKEEKRFRLFRSQWNPVASLNNSAESFALSDDLCVLSDIPEVCESFKTEITFGNPNIQNKKPKIVVFAMRSQSVRFFGNFFSQISSFFDLIVFVLNDDSAHLAVGDLDDLKAECPKINGIHIQIQTFTQIPSIVRLFQKKKFDGIPRFRTEDSALQQLQYTEIPKPQIQISEKEIYLIVGGNSSLGRALIQKIKKQNIHSVIISLSRKPSLSADCIHFPVDILNLSSIDAALSEISKKWPKIDKTIYLIGKKPIKKTEKTETQMKEITAVKVDGYRNLLNSALKNGVILGSMILSSSLSSVVGISSIGEYSSANSFLDSQIFSPMPSALRGLVSIQLPPLKGSTMLNDERNPIFEENSILLEKAADWILRLKDQNGLFAIFHKNPKNLHRDFNPQKSQKEEKTIENIWRDFLGIPKEEQISDSDDFFRMGGNSLSSQQMIWKLQREFNADLSSEQFLRNPKFGTLRNAISNFTVLPKIVRLSEKEEYPLSWSQEQMWILSQMSPKVYKTLFIIHFEGNFRLDFAQKSLRMLMDRQKTLRSRFFLNSQSEVKQSIRPTEKAFEQSVLLDSDLEAVLERERNLEFDLSVETFRLIFVKTKENKWSAIVNQHHLITDGFSVSIFAAEFSEFYRSLKSNSQPALEPLDIDFVDFAEFDRQNGNETKLKEMIERLKDLPPKGTEIREIEGKSTQSRIEVQISEERIQSLTEIQKTTGSSRFLIILTALLRCIDEWRLNAEEPIVIGCPLSGRNFPQISPLISYFLNNLILVLENSQRLYGDTESAVGFVSDCFRESEYFGDVPFHRFVSALCRCGDVQSIFRIFFNYRDRLDFPAVDLGADVECSVEQISSAEEFHLAVTVDEMAAGRLRVCFGSSELSNLTLRLFAEDFLRHLEFQNPKPKTQFNDEIPFESLWSQIFAQIQRKPEATAIIQPNGNRLSYRDLGERIQKLCGILETEKNIAIILDPNESVEWIIAATAIRCPFSPLDPNYSDSRLEAMASALSDPLVICRRKLAGFRTIHPDGVPVEALSALRPSFAQPDDVLYVLFTSGSTGCPKAVAVEHSALSAFIRRSREQFLLTEHSVLGHSVNTTFDVSLFNIFGVLSVGGVLIQKERILDFVLCDLDIPLSHLFLTSAIFNSLPEEILIKLKEKTEWLIVGGETPKTKSMETANRNGCRISQIYGPTETTVWVSFRHFGFGDSGKNIGIPFVPFLIVSASGRQIDGNAVGELWIGGIQLARGYLNSNDEFSVKTENGNFYKTGDLVRRNSDGTLQFVGRLDRQIKRRGIRIDPVEIEMAVSKILSSEFRLLFDGDKICVFFVGEKTFSDDNIRKQLSDYLSPVAVPTDFVALPNGFPINSNGKVDREAMLSLCKTEIPKSPKTIEFEDNYERRLKEIWKSAIGEKEINSKTNFFESGGDSISAFRLHNQMQTEFKVSIPFGQIYRNPEFGKQLKLLKTNLMKEKDILEEISRTPNSKSTLICFHAIGGQTFSYFFLSTIWPQSDIYAIPFSDLYPIESLSELADFYFEKIRQKINSPKIILFGHSLGGILGWEISRRFAAVGIRLGPVLAFDSWVVDNDKIDENSVLNYLRDKFALMKDKDDLMNSAKRLCLLLKSHKFERDPQIPIILFKAERLTQSPLRKVIRNDLTEEEMRMVADNGWRRLSDSVVVRTIPADHDTIIQPEYLSTQIKFFEFVVKQIE